MMTKDLLRRIGIGGLDWHGDKRGDSGDLEATSHLSRLEGDWKH